MFVEKLIDGGYHIWSEDKTGNMKEVAIMAGEVLTKSLLAKVDKAAYQYGGFLTVGGFQKKTAFNLDVRTVVQIEAKYIKGNKEKFLTDFAKTMNAYYFQIILI